MRAFASYILRGRVQAILVAAASAVLALLLPLLSHISGATVALVTLRKGYGEGMVVAAGAALILAGVGYVSTVPFPMVHAFLASTLLLVWLPVVVTGEVLRRGRDLGRALVVAAVLACLAMVLLQLAVGDPAAWWRHMLDAVLTPMLAEAPVPLSEGDKARLLEGLASVMSGFMGAMIVYVTMVNLFIGRWLQAMLFNPGGFRQEFQSLRLGRNAALVALAVMFLVTFGGDSLAAFGQNLLILVVAVFAFHGLALAHAVVAMLGANRVWLVALYVLLLFLPLQAMMALSAAGFADSWVDFRSRLRKRQ
ncbi:MAG TPA: DUF2232 domain-containing protein [Gammaproteobacteria bacterium]|nr:DUF2232 domain-containing protein [Gammaproteobacteria bacterium]